MREKRLSVEGSLKEVFETTPGFISFSDDTSFNPNDQEKRTVTNVHLYSDRSKYDATCALELKFAGHVDIKPGTQFRVTIERLS